MYIAGVTGYWTGRVLRVIVDLLNINPDRVVNWLNGIYEGHMERACPHCEALEE